MISRSVLSAWVLVSLFAAPAQAAWLVKQVKPEAGKATQVIDVQQIDREVKSGGSVQVLRSFPRFLPEHGAPSGGTYEEILYSDDAVPRAALNFKTAEFDFEGVTEVRTIVEQGPKENRINLTMVGDGYTLAEKERFFEDAIRLKDDLFKGQSFASYLPLFNVYAVYVESKESGLTDVVKRNTALGLYRTPKGSKRAIMPGNPFAINAAIKLAPATDYSILIANDEFYGGLGGQYAITTRSLTSGSIVLRHELGHNFGDVGEEYDGGSVYDGANASRTANVSWKHWVNGATNAYETKFLSGEYVWQPLAGGSYVANFDFPAETPTGAYAFEVILSTVGWSTPDDVHVYFDGQQVELKGVFTNDRSFFNFQLPQTPAPGRHKLEIREHTADGDNVLAFAELYAQPPGFNTVPGEIGAFATFDSSGGKSYRPTHSSCPMREMLHTDFCAIDQENMWTRFLARVKLLDETSIAGTGVRTVSVKTPPLAGLELRWYRVETVGGVTSEISVPALDGLSTWTADEQTHGIYRVKIQYKTDEVRKPTGDFISQKDFKL